MIGAKGIQQNNMNSKHGDHTMAHRYNTITGRKEPKPNSTERTKSRWRELHNIQNEYDQMRIKKQEKEKEKAKERSLAKLANKAAAQALLNVGTSLMNQARKIKHG